MTLSEGSNKIILQHSQPKLKLVLTLQINDAPLANIGWVEAWKKFFLT